MVTTRPKNRNERFEEQQKRVDALIKTLREATPKSSKVELSDLLKQKITPLVHEKVLLAFKDDIYSHYEFSVDQAMQAYAALKQKYKENPTYLFPEPAKFDAERAEVICARELGAALKTGFKFTKGDELLKAYTGNETVEDLIVNYSGKVKAADEANELCAKKQGELDQLKKEVDDLKKNGSGKISIVPLERRLYDFFKAFCETSNIPDATKKEFYDIYLSLPNIDLRAEAMIYNNQAGILDREGKIDEALVKVRTAIEIQELYYKATGDSLDEVYLRMYKTNEQNLLASKARPSAPLIPLPVAPSEPDSAVLESKVDPAPSADSKKKDDDPDLKKKDNGSDLKKKDYDSSLKDGIVILKTSGIEDDDAIASLNSDDSDLKKKDNIPKTEPSLTERVDAAPDAAKKENKTSFFSNILSYLGKMKDYVLSYRKAQPKKAAPVQPAEPETGYVFEKDDYQKGLEQIAGILKENVDILPLDKVKQITRFKRFSKSKGYDVDNLPTLDIKGRMDRDLGNIEDYVKSLDPARDYSRERVRKELENLKSYKVSAELWDADEAKKQLLDSKIAEYEAASRNIFGRIINYLSGSRGKNQKIPPASGNSSKKDDPNLISGSDFDTLLNF